MKVLKHSTQCLEQSEGLINVSHGDNGNNDLDPGRIF